MCCCIALCLAVSLLAAACSQDSHYSGNYTIGSGFDDSQETGLNPGPSSTQNGDGFTDETDVTTTSPSSIHNGDSFTEETDVTTTSPSSIHNGDSFTEETDVTTTSPSSIHNGDSFTDEVSPTSPIGNKTKDGVGPRDEEENRISYSISCTPHTVGCKSLLLDEIAASSVNRNQSVTISLSVEQLQLSKTARFSNISQVAILGSHTLLTCTAQYVGIEVRNVGDVRLEDIQIQGCGSLLYVDVPFQLQAALHIMDCNRITIRHTVITGSLGTGLSLHKNTGNVLVEYLNVTDSFLDAGERITGGNGVMLYITSCAIGSEYRFANCTFARNTAVGFRYDFILSIPHFSGNSSSSEGRGGGMRVSIKQSTRHVRVLIVNSRFESNRAFLGAGLSAEIEGQGTGNSVTVSDTTFTGNGCHGNTAAHPSISAGIGGGAYLSFEGLKRNPNLTATNYIINLTTVIFDSNCAELGGGTYFFSDLSDTVDTVNRIEFDNCTWRSNYAHTGSAVDISPNIFKRAGSGFLATPVFRDCRFLHNTIVSSVAEDRGHKERQSYGSGTLYSSLTSIEFQSTVQFLGNHGSGIVAVNGEVNFTLSNASFEENSGIQGGAILLIGTATMIVGSGRSYNFVRNRASDRGGAIHSYLVDDTDFIISRSCFIQYRDADPAQRNSILPSSNWTASLVFEGNTAQRMGHSIYATSVIPCQLLRSPDPDRNDSFIHKTIHAEEIFQPPGIVFEPDDGNTQHIVTEANRFQSKSGDSVLKAIPGKMVDLGVSILDDFDKEVQTTLTAYIMRNSTVEIDSEFSCITEHSIKLKGQEGQRGRLVLQTIGTRKISFALSVELQRCPPGFKLEENECVCKSDMYVGIETCRDNTALLTQGFWAGFIDNGTELGTSICPVGFCSYNTTNVETGVVVLPEDVRALEEAVCGSNRQGILCGQCREGYTTYYHSPHLNCKKARPFSCKLGWLFYVLSELVPVTLLFLFVLALNISFTTGAVNGFILFSQLLDTLLIDASGVIKFPGTITALTRGYQIVYGFFTLDLFTTDQLSFCLWENASVLDVLAFKYITVAYSLLLVLSVILFMKYRAAKCFGRYYSITAFRNSVIHGLSGFLVLSYAQCIKVSFSLLYSQYITLGQDATHQSPSLNRVFFNGNIAYMSRKHLAYALPAILILLVIGVLPPLVLLGHPLLNRVFVALRLEKFWLARCLNCTSKLKPLLDSFQGSFKDNFRFFAGVYFFYRWLAVLTYTIASQLSLFYTVVQALLIVTLVVHSACQPYQKRWHNVLDTLLLADLVVINGLTSLHYYLIRVDGHIHNSMLSRVTMSIQVVLIYLPLVYITSYTVVCLLGKTCCKVVKDEPSTDDFMLKKIGKRIYHSSFSGSGTSPVDHSLPYRLMDREEGNPFEESRNDDKEESTLTV